MRKAIRLKVTLEIQGDDDPAHDFAKATIAAVRDMLAAGHWRHPKLSVNVKDIVEDDDYDSDEDTKKAPATSTSAATAPSDKESLGSPDDKRPSNAKP